MADMVWRPAFKRRRPRARGRARGDRDVRGRPAGHGLRRARRGGLRRPPARAADHRPRAGHPRHPGGRHLGLPRAPLRAALGGRRGGGLGRPRPDRRAGRAHARRARRRGRPRAGAGPGAGGAAQHRALPPQGHRADPRLPRRDRAAARRRPPLRDARARRDLRRPVLLAALPGRARGARAGLLGLLVQRPVLRHGPDRPLPRHAPGQPAPGDAGRARRARPAARDARPPRTSWRGRARTSRRASCSAWSRPARA